MNEFKFLPFVGNKTIFVGRKNLSSKFSYRRFTENENNGDYTLRIKMLALAARWMH